MKNLKAALSDHELIVLRIIGEWWELDLTSAQKLAAVEALSETIAGLEMELEASYLGPEEAEAFLDLVDAGARQPVAAFERRHGEVRQMGPGRLERDEPWLDPVSPAEALWYRGFLFRTFDENEEGELVEFYYIPEELSGQFRRPEVPQEAAEPGAPQVSVIAEPAATISSASDAVDDLTTVLAASQKEAYSKDSPPRLEPYLLDNDPDRLDLLVTLAAESKLLRHSEHGYRPARQAVSWLQKSREAQLRELADAWSSSGWNDLHHTPGLICEGGGWQNDPILGRTALLDNLPRTSEWFRVADLVDLIRDTNPDFQRPDGNYETWYIRDQDSGEYIAGFANWRRVEGRLIRFYIVGPMYWLGLTELSQAGADDKLVFRLTKRAVDWLANQEVGAEEFSVPIVVQPDATIQVPFNANRYHRFQVGRISEAEPIEAGKPYRYRLTPSSLALAKEQGIGPERLLRFLAEAGERTIPASTKRAVERWARQGTEGRLERAVILRVRDSEILDKLRANPKTRPYIAESLGDLAAMVREEDWQAMRQATAALGLLLDMGHENSPQDLGQRKEKPAARESEEDPRGRSPRDSK